MFKTSHRPDGKIAHALALILACATATDVSVNYSMYVPQRHSKLPIAPMGFSHGLRLCLQGGGVLIYGGTVSFSSCTIAGNTAGNVRAHAQNFPSPRWENVICLVDMSISILIFDDGCCLDPPACSRCHLRLNLQKFPSPRWENC